MEAEGEGSKNPSGNDPLPRALLALTAITGIVDAVSFLGFGGLFTAFMTGNVLFVGFSVAGGIELSPAAPLTAIACFVVGVAIGSGIGLATAPNWRRRFFASASTASVLLMTAGLVGLGLHPVPGDPPADHYPVIALTATAMGVRTANMRQLGSALNTTLITLTMVSFVMEFFHGKGMFHPDQLPRFIAVAAVFVGGAVGTLLLRLGLAIPLLVAAIGIITTDGLYLAYPASKKRGEP